MCKAYQRGDCTWGSMCNHAHSEQEMKAHRKAFTEWKQRKGTTSLPAAKPATTASQQVGLHEKINFHKQELFNCWDLAIQV